MKIKTPYTWRKALCPRFNADAVQQRHVRYRPKRLSCFVQKKHETSVQEIKEWFAENEIRETEYKMYGVFTAHPDKMYFEGLCFEFEDENHVLLCKLRF